jgi:single-stranded DNA-specific DHH superfamily exonuclease
LVEEKNILEFGGYNRIMDKITAKFKKIRRREQRRKEIKEKRLKKLMPLVMKSIKLVPGNKYLIGINLNIPKETMFKIAKKFEDVLGKDNFIIYASRMIDNVTEVKEIDIYNKLMDALKGR